ncbi:MAG: shikimate kinase [Leptolyngbyaceae cyanobacterium SM1_3_5]|nr:shikimate kinase [Leptolyngbyaceae cyanobacterium SM1_3_5]
MTDFSDFLNSKNAETSLTTRLKGTNLYLIGMMGAGKSTIGRLVAKQTNYRFFDSDTVIERAAGQTVSEIFSQSGEAEFRQIESQVLGELASYPRSVIATGGGAVLDRKNWSYLHHGVVIWLDVPINVLYTRLQSNTTRPLLQAEDLQERLATIYAERSPLYALADVRIPISAEDLPNRVTQRVLEAVSDALRLN